MEENQEYWHLMGDWFSNTGLSKTLLGTDYQAEPQVLCPEIDSTGLRGHVFIKILHKIRKQVVHGIHLESTAAGAQFSGGEAIWTGEHSLGFIRL